MSEGLLLNGDHFLLQIDTRLDGQLFSSQYRVLARMEPVQQRLKISGQLAPDAALTPLLVQAGLLKAGAAHFEKSFGQR